MLPESPDRTLRMTSLVPRTNATLPRLSHVVRRLEGREFLKRSRCPTDGRATIARLTEAGEGALVAAAPGHVEKVRHLVVDALTPDQISQFDDIATALLERVDPDGHSTGRRGSSPGIEVDRPRPDHPWALTLCHYVGTVSPTSGSQQRAGSGMRCCGTVKCLSRFDPEAG